MMRKSSILFIPFLVLLSIAWFNPPHILAQATIIVNSTADTNVADGNCTLREAINNANNNNAGVGDCAAGSSTARDIIAFDILGGGTISLASNLNISDEVLIDGLTQAGTDCSTWTETVFPNLLIEINGSAGASIGFNLFANASGSLIRGLVMADFSIAAIRFASSNDNEVQCNYLGTDGTSSLGGSSGVTMIGNSDNNIIGLTSNPAVSPYVQRNLISGHDAWGISLIGADVNSNRISGNYIGTDESGTSAIANGTDAILLRLVTDTVVGTDGDGVNDAYEGNVLSGNTRFGVWVLQTASANRIAGNLIGTDYTGTADLGNGSRGIRLQDRVSNNVIGTNGDGVSDTLERNVISGNGSHGIDTAEADEPNNVIAGNIIGLNITGDAILMNAGNGIFINSSGNRIGTNGDGIGDTAERNIISGNNLHGVLITASTATNNIVAGNFIGTDVSGTVDLGNTTDGVQIFNGANSNIIGTNGDGTGDAAEGNIISGNNVRGILLRTAHQNIVAGNIIGLDVTGTQPLGNTQEGVEIGLNSLDNIIGTNGDGISDLLERNIISANGQSGVWIVNNSNNHIVAGNFIGTDITGTVAFGNVTLSGVYITRASTGNRIGTNGDGLSDALEANLISGNIPHGVHIDGAATNTIAGNFIGTTASGTSGLGNINQGIVLANASDTLIGGDIYAEGNLIGFNLQSGILIQGTVTTPNTISHNYIGTTPSLNVIPNGTNGIDLNVNAAISTIIDFNFIYNHPTTGILVRNQSDLGVQGQSIRNCVVDNTAGVNNTTGINSFFEDNYWGARNGPSGVGTGNGDTVSIDVDYEPFLPQIPNRCKEPLVVNTVSSPAVAVFDPAISKLGVLQVGQTGVQGEVLEWIVTVSNTGSVVGNNVVISDTLNPTLRVDSVDAPNATVSINGQSVTVTYATLNVGETVQFSIFTTVLNGTLVENTACVNASNQGAEECATAFPVSQLPSTGESPFWWDWLLWAGLGSSSLFMLTYLYKKPKTKH